MLQAIWAMITILGVATLAAIASLIALLRSDILPTRTLESAGETDDEAEDTVTAAVDNAIADMDNAITEAEANSEAEFRVEYTTPDFTDRAGFQVTAYPNHDIAIPQRFWLINNDTAELEYNIVPGNPLVLRVAKTGALRIPDEYKTESYESVTEYEIDGTTVTQSQSPGRRGMVTWSDGGFDYAILAPSPEMNLLSGMADDFVRNTTTATTTS